MRISVDRVYDKIIWFLTVFLFACFLIFDTYTWGKYAFLAASIMIFAITVLKGRLKIKIKIGAYQWFFLVFIVYSLLTSVWAMNASDTLTMSRTLFRILVCSSLLYFYYVEQDDVGALLRAIMWAGYIVAIYSIIFYGLDTVLAATAGANTRLQNDYSNINSIGMACALTCVIQFHEFIFDKFRLWKAFFLLPTILMMAATQSRKAMILAILGILAVVVLKNADNKNFIKGFFKVVTGLAVVTVCLVAISKIEIFSGINERLTSMFNMFTGEGDVDHSAELRNEMIALGIEWWKQYPVGGIGIANPHILGAEYLNFDAYLHNNFVELLCGGGVIAFLIYYSMYVYLFINLWKYRRADKKFFSICFIWLILMFAMDYGMVSYYSKTQWFYLMAQFIGVECLKKKYKEAKNENK